MTPQVEAWVDPELVVNSDSVVRHDTPSLPELLFLLKLHPDSILLVWADAYGNLQYFDELCPQGFLAYTRGDCLCLPGRLVLSLKLRMSGIQILGVTQRNAHIVLAGTKNTIIYDLSLQRFLRQRVLGTRQTRPATQVS